MLGTSSLQHCFSEVNLSSIMAATVSMFTSSVDSPIHSSASSFSSAHLFTTSQDDIPSIYMTLPKKKDFSICDSFKSLSFTSISDCMNIVPVSIDIPLNQTQSDPLVSIHQQIISSSEVIANFGEDAVVSFGKYYWSKKDKAVVKRGLKKARHGSGKDVSALGQVIWKADTSNLPQEAMDSVVAMGVFARSNFNTVSQLSLDFGEKEKELDKLKHDLARQKIGINKKLVSWNDNMKT